MSGSSARISKTAVVIGSGFGGAVTACRLVQAARQKQRESNEDWKIVLLERGRRYGKDDFPRLQLPASMTQNPDLASSQRLPDLARFSWRNDFGLYDLRNLGGLMVLQSAGYGGGSLIYASVMLRAPERVLADWPERYHYSKLLPYYQLAEWMLGATIARDDFAKTRHFERAVHELDRDVVKLPLAVTFASQPGGAEAPERNRYGRSQGKCNGCGDCVIGCTLHAKNTLDLNYLAQVEDASDLAEVWTMAEVTRIERRAREQRRALSADAPERKEFVVHVTRRDQGDAEVTCEADYVFLGAGAIGTTELLLHSREALGLPREAEDRLGRGFFGNGDSLGVVFDTEKPSTPWSGPTITRGTVYNAGSGDDHHWFLVEDGGIPPTLRRVLGYFHSGMWLGRNRFAAPKREARPAPRVAPLTDIILDLPVMLGLLTRRMQPAAASTESGWLRYAPKDFRPLLELLRDPDGRLRREVSELDERVLERFRRELGRRYGLAAWLPGLGKLINREVLLESVLATLRDRYGVLNYLPKPGQLGEALTGLFTYLTLGRGPTSNSSVLLCMGPDQEWHLKLEHGRVRAERTRSGSRSDVGLYGAQECLLRDLASKLQGELRTNPSWTIGKRPVTVHSQGGAGMPSTARERHAHAVTDELGRVRTDDGEALNVFVMDGAGFPTSVGVNPSLTIAAVAELKIESFIRAVMQLPNFSAADAEPARPEPPATRPLLPESQVPLIEHALQKPPKVAVHGAVGLKWHEWIHGSCDRFPSTPGSAPKPNVRDCVTGDKRGTKAGRHLSFELDCVVDDLESFYLQPKPTLRVTGKLNRRNLAPARDETFDCKGELWLGFEAGSMTSMNYELHFTVGSREVGRMLGTKFLADDPGMDSILDLTTLYCVFEWTKEDGADPEIELGVVRVPMATFMAKQLPTFELLEAEGLDDVARTWAAARFADFFFGGIKATYLPELFVPKIVNR